MILSELYKALLTRITGLADVKHLAYNRGQLETDEDFDHLQFPVVLVEFLPFEPKAMGQKRQGADMQIVLTIASEVVQNTDARETDTIRNLGLAHMVLLDNIHALLQGWNGLGLTPTVNFNALNRTGFSPYDGVAGLENGMLMVHTMTYTTRIIDDAALVIYELMNPQPGLEINGVYYAPVVPPEDPDPPVPPETHVHSIVPGEGISVDASDPENPVVTNTGVLELVEGNNVTIDNTDPQRPVIHADGGGGGGIETIVAGSGISVDASDPVNPVVGLGFNPKLLRPSEGIYLIDEFIGGGSTSPTIGELGWNSTGAGASNGLSTGGSQLFNGQVRLQGGTTNTGWRNISLNTYYATDINGEGAGELFAEFRIRTPSPEITDYGITRIGFGNSNTSADHTNGYYFEQNLAVSPNWIIVTAANGVYTRTTTTVPMLSFSTVKLTLRVASDNSSVEFSIDGVVVGTHTTNIPNSSSSQICSPVIFYGNVIYTSQLKFLWIDYFESYKIFNTPR